MRTLFPISPVLRDRLDRLAACDGHWVLIRDGEPETDCSHHWQQSPDDHLATCLRERWRGVSLGFVPGYCGYSDYSRTGLVGLSNYRVITDPQSTPDPRGAVLDVGYGWNGRGVVLDVLRVTSDHLETVEALENHPLISEDDYSELECNVIESDWVAASIAERVRMLQDLGLCIFAARDDLAPWRDGFDSLRDSIIESANEYPTAYA